MKTAIVPMLQESTEGCYFHVRHTITILTSVHLPFSYSNLCARQHGKLLLSCEISVRKTNLATTALHTATAVCYELSYAVLPPEEIAFATSLSTACRT